MRKWVTARALVFHLLLILIVGGCAVAAWWQIGRAAGGNTLSYLYSVEWPVFAITAIVGWWQLIHEDPADVESRRQERLRRGRPNPIGYDAELLRRELSAHPELLRSFPELARAYPELAAAGVEAPGAEAAGGADGRQAGEGALPASVAATASPAATGDDRHGDESRGGPEEPSEPIPAASRRVQEYNDMLAAYAAHGRAKSWRNPKGR